MIFLETTIMIKSQSGFRGHLSLETSGRRAVDKWPTSCLRIKVITQVTQGFVYWIDMVIHIRSLINPCEVGLCFIYILCWSMRSLRELFRGHIVKSNTHFLQSILWSGMNMLMHNGNFSSQVSWKFDTGFSLPFVYPSSRECYFLGSWHLSHSMDPLQIWNTYRQWDSNLAKFLNFLFWFNSNS